MGPEVRRRLKLRNLPNAELLRLYDSEIVLRLHNIKNLNDTRKLLAKFVEYLGNFPPSAELAKSFLAQYADRKPRTVSRYAKMVCAFMYWYGEPIDGLKIKIPRSVPKYIEDEEIQRVRAEIEKKKTHKKTVSHDLLLFDLALKSGLRRSELANLQVRDIHEDFLEVRSGKGGKDRNLPLAPAIADRLHKFVAGKKADERVFGLTPGSISNKIRNFADKAGVKQVHTHTLRHKFAIDVLEKGGNVRVLQDLMGHDNLNTTQVYLTINPEDRRKAILSLSRTGVNGFRFSFLGP